MRNPSSSEACSSIEQEGWLTLRSALWPDGSREENLREMRSFLEQPERFCQFVAYSEARVAIGLVEAAVRFDHVNGTEGSPVAFLEGIYVVPACRSQGVAAKLVARVEEWAVAHGCSELASDAPLDNRPSHAVHRALGFRETERVVYFSKRLR